MLNLVLIAGGNVETVAGQLDESKYKIVKQFEYLDDAFNCIVDNGGEYLDVDVILAFQQGFKSDENQLQQIDYLQQAVLVSELSSKLYFILKEKETYNLCEEKEGVLTYDKTRILYLEKLPLKTIEDLIEGKLDNQGIGQKVELEEIIEYTEELLETTEEEEKESRFEVRQKEEPEKEEKKKGLFNFVGGRDRRTRDREDIRQRHTRKQRQERQERVTQTTGMRVNPGVIVVTGDRNTGVTTTSSFLAETYADSGMPVLLLDFDFKRRGLSLLYHEFAQAEQVFTNTQLGVYTALNNTDMIEEVQVVVKDNLALISMSREEEYRVKSFADKNLRDVVNSQRLTTLMGVAKGMYGAVIIDMPFEELIKYPDIVMLVDKFVVCCENTLYSIGNLFSILMTEMSEKNEVITASILDRMNIVLTRFSMNSKYDRDLIDEKFVQVLLKENIHNRIKVVGKISHTEVFHTQIEKGKRVIDLKQETRSELEDIVRNINTY